MITMRLLRHPGLATRLATAIAATALMTLAAAATPAAAERDNSGRDLVVRVDSGQLRGVRIGAADAFLGVPFAASPVGSLRFAPPVPAADWSGVRDATRQAPACLQFQPGGVRETQTTGEDCLYLDVYRPPGTEPTARLPVIVWIHGGGFTQGAGVIYGGQTLAARTRSVVVSLNYRVGALGYLALDQLDARYPSTGSGNWGTLDQIRALQWVRHNIAVFGGDARRVTIAGQSAGGASVCTMLGSPKATGLFQRATIQSAYCGLGERSLANAQAQGAAFADHVGCPDAASRLACLRLASAPKLVSAFKATGGAGPTIGTPTLPVGSAEAITTNRWNRVPVIIGATTHEGKLFFAPTPDITAADYRTWLADTFGNSAAEVAARYPVSDYPAPFYAQAEAFGDFFIYCGMDRTANLLATRTSVHRYEFDDPDSPTLYGFQPEGIDMSSAHSAELAYLFDFTLGAAPVPAGSARLATQMKRHWASFAADADPNGRGLPYWPPYRTSTHRTLILRPDGPTVSTTVSREHHCAFWAGLGAASSVAGV
jgi:para-nitrobenzyl esterase